MSVPTTLTQFLSIAVPVTVNVCLFALLSGCLVFTGGKWAFISSPLNTESKVAKAKGLCGWMRAVASLTDDDVMKAGGLDAYLALKRAKMRAEIVLRFCGVAALVAIAYSLNVTGGATEGGFSRITFENANIQHKNDGVKRTGSDMLRIWVTVLACYLMPLLAVPVIERHDEEAVQLMLEESKKAPIQHYAVVLTGIEEESRDESIIRAFFDAALGADSVRRVYLLKNESAVPDGVVDDEDADEEKGQLASAAKMAGSLLTSLGGSRQRHDAFKAALQAAKRADLAYAEAKEKAAASAPSSPPDDDDENKTPTRLDSIKSMVKSKSPEEQRKEARAKLERKRQDLARAETGTAKSTAAAVVVFDSIAKATSAATAPLGIANAWRVAPAPEPRDVLWAALETADADQEIIDHKASTGERIKFMIAASWSIILAALGIAAGVVLKFAEKQLSGPLKDVVVLVSGFVPGLIAPIMMSLMVTILNNINVTFRAGVECWSTSGVQKRTENDFTFFLAVVGFFVPLMGSALITSILSEGADALQIFKSMAINVPMQGYYFTMIVLVKMAVYVNGATRFVPYVVYRVMDKIFCKTDFERSQFQKPPPFVFAAGSGWETFAFLLASVYTQLSPYVPAFMALYLLLQVPCMRLDLSCISKTPFATNGALWRQCVSHTYHAMFAGMLLTLGVLLFSGAPVQFACSLPLIIVHSVISLRAQRRYELRSVHGCAAGRLPLLEASEVDKVRNATSDAFVDATVLPPLDHDKLYAPPHVLPWSSDEERRAFLPGPPLSLEENNIEHRQQLIQTWETRYDHPSKLPQLGALSGKDEVDAPPHFDDADKSNV